ncbi:hypothetical protein D9M68_655350 [compost metagenome]
MCSVAEDKGHVEHVYIRYHRADSAEADARHLHGADLHLLDHFFLGAEHATGKHLELEFAVAGFLDFLAHVFLGNHGRVAGRVDFGDLQGHVGLGQARQAEGEGKGGDKQLAFETHGNLRLVVGFCSAANGEVMASERPHPIG